jgi:hypothetical protein
MKEKHDAELMRLVNEKHGHALEELYDRYINLVYGFVISNFILKLHLSQYLKKVIIILFLKKRCYFVKLSQIS